MSKTKRRWIAGTKRTGGAGQPFDEFSSQDALTGDHLAAGTFFGDSLSIAEAIQQGLSGIAGPKGVTGLGGPSGIQGDTGLQGLTGLALGSTGVVGIQGVTGFYGDTGLQGSTGFYGETGIRGLQGPVGPQGLTGNSGTTGIYGQTGIQGLTGYYGKTGIQGVTGISGGGTGLQGTTGLRGPTGPLGGPIGATGVQGATGAGAFIQFNNVSRYSVDNTTDQEVWLVSSSTLFGGLAWDSTGGTLRMQRSAHGHSVGDRVILRNTTADNQTTTIDTTDSTSFTCTVTSLASTSGIAGAYSLGFTFTSSPGTGGEVNAPTGDHADCQLISMRVRTGTTSGSYELVVPASATNGAGANTSLANCYVPDFNVRNDSDALSAIASTMTTNISGSYSTFKFGNLGTPSRNISLHF